MVRRLVALGNEQPGSAPVVLKGERDLDEALATAFSVGTLVKSKSIADRYYWQRLVVVLLADCLLQRSHAPLVPVVCDEDKSVCLSKAPENPIIAVLG